LPVFIYHGRYYGAWIEEEDQIIYLQTEYCDGGSLQTLFKQKKQFTEEELLDILRQIGSVCFFFDFFVFFFHLIWK
jgi:serine/threonine protein kinase